MTFKKWVGMTCVGMAIAAASDSATAGTATPESIIVMPARARVVQLAYQISQLKDVGLVTYNNSPALREPLIHVWNGQEWIQVTMQDYVQGSFMSGDPKHVFLLGDSNTTPLRMMDDVAWYKDLHRLTTLDTTTLINEMGNALKFSSRQWKWLAEENGLKIQDQNAERRRYGRWGAPGQEKNLKPNALESIELPPAAIITEPKAGKIDLPVVTPVAPVKPAAPEKVTTPVKPVTMEKPAVEPAAVAVTLPTEPVTKDVEEDDKDEPAKK